MAQRCIENFKRASSQKTEIMGVPIHFSRAFANINFSYTSNDQIQVLKIVSFAFVGIIFQIMALCAMISC